MKLAYFADSSVTLENQAPESEPINSEETKGVEFPLPQELVPDTLSGIKITCEQINYTVDTAQKHISLLESSLDIVEEDKDISDLSMAAIVSQLNTTSRLFTTEDELIVQQLAEKLTTDNPYKYEAILESLNTSLASLRNIVHKGLSPLMIVNNYLDKNINLPGIVKELSSVGQVMTPAPRAPEEIKEGGSTLKDYDLIVQAIQSNQNPEMIPEFISSRSPGDSDISTTACTLINKGLKGINLQRTRILSVSDLHELAKYLETVIAVQKVMDSLLDSIISAINVQTIDEVVMTNLLTSIKASLSTYWQAVNALTNKVEGNDGSFVFNIMEDMPGVILGTNGHSSTPRTVTSDGLAILKQNTLGDLSLYMSTVASRKFNVIVKNSGNMNTKIGQITELSNRIFSSQTSINPVLLEQFSASFGKLVLASKFMSDLTFTATEAFQSTCNAISNVARGIAILTESP